MDSQAKKLQILCNDIEQYSQGECVEIQGIPVSEHEDTNKIVVRVGKLMGVEIKEDNILVSHRLPTISTLLLLNLFDVMLKKGILRVESNSRTI